MKKFTTAAVAAVIAASSLGLAATAADAQSYGARGPARHEQAQDRQHGGYSLEAGSKQLVGQARMMWGFSHAHLFGLSSADHDYLAAARQGYEFLIKHFLDKQHGGYYWLADETGDVTNPNKMLYGQAFVIYGLVEYYRASGDKGALRQAQDQFRVVQRKAYDSKYCSIIAFGRIHFGRSQVPQRHSNNKLFVHVLPPWGER